MVELLTAEPRILDQSEHRYVDQRLIRRSDPLRRGDDAEIGVGQSWLRRDSSPVTSNRIVEPTLLPEGITEQPVGFARFRIARNGAAQTILRFGNLAFGQQNVGNLQEVAWMCCSGPPQADQCLVAMTMSEEQPGQPRMSFHVGCRKRNGAPVSGDSLLIATETLQGHAEIAVQSGEFGVERGCSLEAFRPPACRPAWRGERDPRLLCAATSLSD